MIWGVFTLICFVALMVVCRPSEAPPKDDPWCVKIKMDGKRYNRAKDERWF